MTRSVSVTLVAGLWLLLIASPDAQQPRKAPSIDRLVAIASERGTVDVIVELAAAMAPEHTLADTAALDQRERLHVAQDSVIAGVPGIVAGSVKRFETIPGVAMTVDLAGLAALASRPDVVSIVEDAVAQHALVHAVPLIGASTLHTSGIDGTGWVVAVVDDGFQTDHPMLAGKVVAEGCFSSTTPSESRCPGGAAQSTAPGSSNVCAVAECKHGTHVASTAAGRTVTEGVASISGVAKGAQLITISVFNKTTGASTSNIVLGLERVYALRNTFKIAAVNMSLQAGRFFSPDQCDSENPQYKTAIDNLRAVGIPAVVASGNSGWRDSMAAPGCVSTAVSVGNTTKDDIIYTTSNQGYWQTLMAPGTNLLAAYPGSSYGQLTGTSMASPQVAGVWALLKQRTGGAATVSQGISAFRSTALPLQDVMGNWYARIRADQGLSQFPTVSAMPDVLTPPGTPVQVPFTLGDAQQGPNGLGLQLFTTNVGLTPTYQVLGTGAQRTLRVDTAAGMSGTATITLVASDGTYQTASRFLLSVGAAGPPGPPSNFAANLAGTTLSLSWSPPTTGAPATEYVLQAALDPGFGNIIVNTATGSAQTSMVIPGVPPGVFYLRILARNGLGTSGPSNVQQLGGPPGAPSGLVATLQGSVLSMSWNAPTTGGAPSDYVLEAATDPGFGSVIFAGGIGSARSVTIGGVPPGTFFLRVRARNGSGISGPSNSQQIGSSACAGPPSAPANFGITKLGGLSVRLSWSPAGGSPTAYVLQAALDPSFASIIASVPVGGVMTLDIAAVPGTFFVRVLAGNSCGNSGPSNSASVTLP